MWKLTDEAGKDSEEGDGIRRRRDVLFAGAGPCDAGSSDTHKLSAKACSAHDSLLLLYQQCQSVLGRGTLSSVAVPEVSYFPVFRVFGVLFPSLFDGLRPEVVRGTAHYRMEASQLQHAYVGRMVHFVPSDMKGSRLMFKR